VSTGALNASSFWTDVLSKYRPHVMRGGAASATDLSSWTNEALLKVCKLENGAPWRVLVEKQNRITQNDRHPLMPGDWDFCKFLTEYQKPEYDNMLYLVTGIADKGLRLPSLIGLPSVLACDDLYHALHDARLWMSRGNTTSSLHFDTHDNLLMQIDGEKEVLMWHPNASAQLYMDHHDKFGLSPVNCDRVDLQRFPEVANAPTYYARTRAGDMIYIPDGWWHVIRSHGGERGRNVAIALELAPYAGEHGKWPTKLRSRHSSPGVYWAEQARISAYMHEALAAAAIIPSRRTRMPFVCDAPLEHPPKSLADCEWLGKHPQY